MADGPVIDQLNLVVGDMEASLAFYRLLGVEPVDSAEEWRPHHRSAAVGVDLDFDSVAFARIWDAGSAGPSVVIGFKLASREAVDEMFAQLTRAGYPGRQEPYDAFWGARYAVVADPDGNPVGLMSPVDPDRRSQGPDPTSI
jgi:catechol 2,3-dioxygenase-like lactoylglutathione lyase family enzyme